MHISAFIRFLILSFHTTQQGNHHFYDDCLILFNYTNSSSTFFSTDAITASIS